MSNAFVGGIDAALLVTVTTEPLALASIEAPGTAGADIAVGSGYIALQSESHPVQFRNIRLLPIN